MHRTLSECLLFPALLNTGCFAMPYQDNMDEAELDEIEEKAERFYQNLACG